MNDQELCPQVPIELTIVVPTFKERDNVEELIRRVGDTFEGVNWEMVFVDDDSPDGTADLVFEINRSNPIVRGIKRIGRRGLSSACIEGICSSSAPYIAVMDADMQHDERILPKMLETLKENGLDVVVGSRFVSGGSTGGLPSFRVKMSRLATVLGQKLLGVKTSDPMSGFFVFTRSFFYEVVRNLSGKGFKILLDMMASCKREVKFAEVPYDMRARHQGQSKLDSVVLWEYMLLLVEKTIGKYIPVRFIFFVLIGILGALSHLLVLGTAFKVLELPFSTAQAAAIIVAMTINFFFDNMFTYADRRLRGKALWRGLAIFYLVCSTGALINLIISNYLFDYHLPWYVAGLIGAGIGAVWNYSISTHYTWKAD